MEVLPEAHGRSSEQHEPLENLRKEAMENDRGEAFGYGSTTLRPRQCAVVTIFGYGVKPSETNKPRMCNIAHALANKPKA